MPFLTSGAGKYELRIGANTLGGNGEDAVAVPELAELEPAARITAEANGAAVIERLAGGARVSVDGEPLGPGARPLRHGARVDVRQLSLTYAAAARGNGRGKPPAPREARRPPAGPTEVVPIFASPAASGRLVEVGTARTFHLPMSGAVIGRDVACDVVVAGTGVSRRHAVIRPGAEGFAVTDESTNGTYVNGDRAAPGQLLAHGDLLRVGTNEFRFETHAPRTKPDAGAQAATEVHAALGPVEAAPREAAPASAGSLQITRGALLGKAFQLDRPVCSIGRAEHNDVRITDSSVSASHATLLLKAGTWYVVDLRSANGTYVDGYRVGAERALHGPCTIRVGAVKLEFRPPANGPVRAEPAKRRGGLLQRLASLW